MPWEPTKIAGLVAAIGGAVATAWGGVSFIDDRYGKTAEIQEVKQATTFVNLRLEEKILTDRVAAIQQRIWKLEDRYGDTMTTAPDTAKEEHRQMQTDLASMHEQIVSVMDAYRRQGYPATENYYKYEQPHR